MATTHAHEELFAIVRTAVATYGEDATLAAIMSAHAGRPDDEIVRSDNLHLFRRYRNSVSPNPRHLITAATDSTN